MHRTEKNLWEGEAKLAFPPFLNIYFLYRQIFTPLFLVAYLYHDAGGAECPNDSFCCHGTGLIAPLAQC
ncbi:MAG: hypothetical protein ORN57_00165 [Alphaproteobacteria bacterium]|nr:hypothetical protein [Alphaproteobacteria bacterium]